MGPKNADDALLARLNALRPTNVTLETSTTLGTDSPKVAATSHQSCVDGSIAETPHNDEDDALLDDLLNDAGLKNEWDLTRDDEHDVKKLTADAQAALKLIPDQLPRASNDDESHSIETPGTAGANDASESVSDEQEAQDIIAKVLAELEVERHDSESIDPPSSTLKDSDAEHDKNHGDPLNFALPSAPSEAPRPSTIDDTEEDALAARFSSLSLPGAPSFSPSKKPTKIVKSNLPKYTDEDMDSWCVICNDDATVKCTGCDGDLYCRSCWKEGHIGPDAGFEEKQHLWTKFNAKKGS